MNAEFVGQMSANSRVDRINSGASFR